MARLKWDTPGEHGYEVGIDRGVFYPLIGDSFRYGIAWNGLTGFDDNIEGREANHLFSGGVKKAQTPFSYEEYGGKISCYTYPDAFERFLGETEIAEGVFAKQQARGIFGFCYRSLVGTDIRETGHWYKLHLIYNMRVVDFSRSYSSLTNSVELDDLEISFETYPLDETQTNLRLDPLSEIIINSRRISSEHLKTIEDILYGTENVRARLPYPDEIYSIITAPTPQVIPAPALLYPYIEIYPDEMVYPRPRGFTDGS